MEIIPSTSYRKIPMHKVGNTGFPKVDRRIRNVAAHAEGIWFGDFSPEIPIFISTFQFFMRFAGTTTFAKCTVAQLEPKIVTIESKKRSPLLPRHSVLTIVNTLPFSPARCSNRLEPRQEPHSAGVRVLYEDRNIVLDA